VIMAVTSDQAVRQYLRLPRTIALTVAAGLLLVVLGVQVLRMRERRLDYLTLGAKYSQLADEYTQRSQDDLDGAKFGEDSVPDLDKMLRNAEADGSGAEAAGVREMIAANQRTCSGCTPRRRSGPRLRRTIVRSRSGTVREPIGLGRWLNRRMGSA